MAFSFDKCIFEILVKLGVAELQAVCKFVDNKVVALTSEANKYLSYINAYDNQLAQLEKTSRSAQGFVDALTQGSPLLSVARVLGPDCGSIADIFQGALDAGSISATVLADATYIVRQLKSADGTVQALKNDLADAIDALKDICVIIELFILQKLGVSGGAPGAFNLPGGINLPGVGTGFINIPGSSGLPGLFGSDSNQGLVTNRAGGKSGGGIRPTSDFATANPVATTGPSAALTDSFTPIFGIGVGPSGPTGPTGPSGPPTTAGTGPVTSVGIAGTSIPTTETTTTEIVTTTTLVNVLKNHVLIGTRKGIDFIEGNNVVLTILDMPGSDEVSVAINVVTSGISGGGSGATGPRGATGSAGLPGPPGLDGEAGSDGPQGATGPQGTAGSSTTGAVGNTGATGTQGMPGVNGEDGDVGQPGPVGATGAQGTTGPTGATGPQGATGSTVSGTTDPLNWWWVAQPSRTAVTGTSVTPIATGTGTSTNALGLSAGGNPTVTALSDATGMYVDVQNNTGASNANATWTNDNAAVEFQQLPKVTIK